MERYLAGRIEKVFVEYLTDHAGIAHYDGYETHVNNARCQNRHCLARFELNQKRPLTANFISSAIQADSLHKKEYLLCGRWEMETTGEFPTPEEIKRYYDPGDMGEVIYIKRGHTRKKGKGIIRKTYFYPIHRSIEGIIEKRLQNPYRESRILLAEAEEDIEKIIKAAKELELKAIRMERLQ